MRALTRLPFAAVMFLSLLAATPAQAAAPVVSSTELVEQAAEWDGELVSFTGEAIGSAMERGEFTWLHLNDDAYGAAEGSTPVRLEGYNSGQAILVPTELAKQVTRFGSYRERGDRVMVEGIFHAADSRYGGDMLIEAESLIVISAGEQLANPVATWKLFALVMLGVCTVAAYNALAWRRRGTVLGRPRNGH
jgi:hypothetical protein